MKRYIRSSFSPSMPDWLRKRMSARFGGLKEKFLKKGVALDRAEFMDHEELGSRPIYLLQTDYGQEIYAPGFNDDDTTMINGRQRKLGSIAKSRLPEMAIDTVYIDLTGDGGNLFEKREKYEDPRYSYRHNPKGSYAGQYKKRDFKGLDENGNSQYGPEYWSDKGMTPSNESRARDKSGYKIPTPEQKIADYYNKFPERVTDKVDELHDRLIEVRQEVTDVDLDLGVSEYGEDYLRKAYEYLSRAIERYRNLLASLDENRMLKGRFHSDDWNLREFSRTVRSIQEYLDEIGEMLDKIG